VTALFGAVAILGLPYTVFWPYALSTLVLVVGLAFIVRNELPQAQGIDRVLPFGRLLYCIPVAGFAGEHFVFARGMTSMVPDYLPFHLFWIIFCGIGLLAAALAISTKVLGKLAGLLLSFELFTFVVLLSLPALFDPAHDRFTWALVLRDSSFAAAALAFAGGLMPRRANGSQSPHLLVRIGQTIIGASAIFFGVEHFLHPDHVPALPLEKMMPAYIPLPTMWMYLMGAILVVAGVLLLANWHAFEAALAAAFGVVLMMLIVYTPILLKDPGDIATAFNYFMDTLMYAGALFLLAGALPHASKSSVAIASADKSRSKEGLAHA
jgi:uncharacterized membrane protein